MCKLHYHIIYIILHLCLDAGRHLPATVGGFVEDAAMLDPDGMLLRPDRSRVRLREIAGWRGLVVVGVGRGGERGFQMVYRFHDVGEQLAAVGIHLAFVYPRESARHVLDAVSVASTRFRGHPWLLLDADDQCFAQGIWPRSLEAVYLNPEMKRLAGVYVDLQVNTWERELRAFFGACEVTCPDSGVGRSRADV